MAKKLQEIKIIFVDELFRFENATGDVIVATADLVDEHEERTPIKVKGECDVDEMQAHQSYRLYGSWSKYHNKRTGESESQFWFKTFTRAKPHGRAGVIAYLQEAGRQRGIGRARAEKLWQKFGSDAIRVLRETPDVAASVLAGLSTEKAEEAAEWLKEQYSLEGCTIELIDLLSGRGFPKNLPRKVVKELGNRAADVIRKDPYILMYFRGCGFRRCDDLWKELGLPLHRLRRQAYCAWYGLASSQEGHTWFPAQYAVQQIDSQVGGSKCRPLAALKLAKRIGRLNLDHHGAISTLREDGGAIVETGGRVWVAEGRKAWHEERLAEKLADAFCEAPQWPSIDNLEIDDHQRCELEKSLQGTVGILGGGPGTGKTYTAAALLKALIRHFGYDAIVAGAPTGKAAVRLSESFEASGVPIRARTWHSILGIGKPNKTTGQNGFKHNEQNPLPYKVLLGDESSMNDTALMSSIFAARPGGCHVLLIGDVNQLPPVGHGAPLRDMIAAGVPYGELTEIKRNSGGIVEACDAIRESRPWRDGDNLRVRAAWIAPEQIERILESINEARSTGLDPVWDCQVVVPVNDKSDVSRKKLNQILQRELNPNVAVEGNPFRLCDKIVNTKNGWFPSIDYSPDDPDLEVNDEGEVYVANGELAEVVHCEPKLMVARLNNPSRTIKVFRGAATAQEPDRGDGENSDKSSTGCSWVLGYALSVHKSQGSEWARVIVVIDEYAGAKRLCTREWLYTAISRAKLHCDLIGKKTTADQMCKKVAIWNRKTFLRELIGLKQVERTLVEI